MFNKLKIFCKNPFYLIKSSIMIYGIIVCLFINISLLAQSNPQVIQDLSFGSFYTGSSGGAVVMPSRGARYADGSVVLFKTDTGNPAIVRMTSESGSHTYIITIGNVTGLANGSGGLMKLDVYDIYPASPFNTAGQSRDYDFYIGGTLYVSAVTPSGSYSGSFDITFNHQ